MFMSKDQRKVQEQGKDILGEEHFRQGNSRRKGPCQVHAWHVQVLAGAVALKWIWHGREK